MRDFNVNKEVKTEEVEVREARKEIQLVNSAKWVKGLNVFELNLKTMSLRQIGPIGENAEVIEKKHLITGQKVNGMQHVTRKMYKKNEDCAYIQAINKKNAGKKFVKYLSKAVSKNIS